MPIALVSSGSVAPSYPRAQNTSRARSRASSASNCRVRPEGMATLSSEKMLMALANVRIVHCTARYKKTKKRNVHLETTRGLGRSAELGLFDGEEGEKLAPSTPLGRLGTPGDIAPAVVSRAPDGASWIPRVAGEVKHPALAIELRRAIRRS